MKTLSIIIPSYNTEKFLNKNLPQFLNHEIQDKLEILIINDGSNDNTEKIAKKWEQNYQGIIRVISKSNGGHGSVINCGIKEASGKYFKVVDGDDWVNTKGLVSLLKFLENSNTDLVVNSYFLCNEQTGKYQKKEFRNVEKKHEYTLDNVIKKIDYIPLHAWTIKTSILGKNKLWLTEKCFYEDFEYVIYPIPYINTVIFLDFPVYVYLVGQQVQSVSDKSVLKNANMHMQIIQDSIKYYENVKMSISCEKSEYIYLNILNLIKSHYNIYLRNYLSKGVYDKMLEADKQLFQVSQLFYGDVGKKYRYIVWIRKNKLYFLISAVMIKVLKAIMNKRGKNGSRIS